MSWWVGAWGDNEDNDVNYDNDDNNDNDDNMSWWVGAWGDQGTIWGLSSRSQHVNVLGDVNYSVI